MKRTIALAVWLLVAVAFAYAQSPVLSGKITDKQGTPVPGASIQVKGTKNGTAAAADGSFKIAAKEGDMLIVTAMGFITSQIKAGSSNFLPITLQEDTRNINEVVVTALGIKRDKRMLTYSVQEVKGASVVEAKQDNLVNALAGKVAGVQIGNSSGIPGSSARIVIRGNTSLVGNNQALFVVDGVPMDNSEAGNPNRPEYSGGTTNRASDIDPNIIESISVLKGAAATALYGSAAARGAVIITTKNGTGAGKAGKPTLSINSSYSFQTPILPKFQDKFAQGSEGIYIDGNNGELSSSSWGPAIDTLKVNGQPVKKHNPAKEFFRTGHTTDNNINLSGFSDRSNYLISYSYLKTNGTIPNTDYSRHALFLKYGVKVWDKLQLNAQFNYIQTNNHRYLEGNNFVNPLWTVYGAPISWDPRPSVNEDGSQRLYRAGRNNPYWILDNTGLGDKTNRILPVVSLSYNPLPWLTITERLGADMYVNTTDYHEAPGAIGWGNSGATPITGQLYKRDNKYQQFNNDLMIEARKEFNKDWFGNILIGNNILTTYSDNNFVQGVGLGVSDFYNISNAEKVTSSYAYYRTRKVGFYAQANIEYKRMLSLGLTGRYDGSSVLSADKQFYPYGSASAGFIFTEALKMADNRILNFGKIRVSYAAVGNDNVSPYLMNNPYYQAGVGNVQFPYQGQNGYLRTTTYGFPLKNESLKEFEVGLETRFFQNRASLEVSWFHKRSADLLTPGSPVSAGTGYPSISVNAGSMENKGLEVVLGVTPIKTKNFNWNIGVNYSKISNKVLNLSNGIQYLQFAGFTHPGVFAYANQPYGVIYGNHFLRNDQNQLIVTEDGYPIISQDYAPIGNASPKWIGGLTSNMTYKGFSFSFVLEHKHGGDVINLDNSSLYYYGTHKVTENRGTEVVLPGVVEHSGAPNTKAITMDEYYYKSYLSAVDESSVEDGSYFKLRQVSLAYNLGDYLLKNKAFKNLTLSVTGTNFILHKNYTGSDPEVSLNGSGNGQGFSNFSVPANRSIIIGLKAVF
ncbi:SusC/RagA family TonB-linked outer membrane protein [Chitinophaga nivalis]|uniref:SusC/RagA family TonB-linked outer membrane protein n=1 Tax=Chitinophaga nivalis TaxID=2991709 RepID=A0ABT3II08_9BACT|nr:SusC/RagA family TonB-linked outer membrane protein [Chitinophaga nivalis]MCW3466704.1 SusC/RagA family TonB-linked outer membrane protein [Chitinophaga nivalis]MCW3483605.1 SusC/RagA family TonB-linked outer membrane protein [Chitinophaga nivalis]